MSNLVEIAYNEQIQKIKASGVKMVDNSTWQYRLNNCKKCKHYQKFTTIENIFKCTQCGCNGYKFLIESIKCPLIKPKWK